MYVMCVKLCLFSALSRRVGALQMSIIIISSSSIVVVVFVVFNARIRGLKWPGEEVWGS